MKVEKHIGWTYGVTQMQHAHMYVIDKRAHIASSKTYSNKNKYTRIHIHTAFLWTYIINLQVINMIHKIMNSDATYHRWYQSF